MDFEHLRMLDLVERFRASVERINETRSAALLKQAGENLQNIYNFHLTADASFSEVEEYLKNMYSSFNYAAVIVNDALKKKTLDVEGAALLNECIEILLKCCNAVAAKLNEK